MSARCTLSSEEIWQVHASYGYLVSTLRSYTDPVLRRDANLCLCAVSARPAMPVTAREEDSSSSGRHAALPCVSTLSSAHWSLQ
mmetsp:Transcript_45089/g.101836  ORF Transcript_45089/g.101836 Transcript_45089/m.101836 type:complete len:84 (-) Transcript_45089:218-469(-)